MTTEPTAAGARPTEAPLLDVRDLRVTYRTGTDEVHAVRGVNFTVEAGQMLGMAGESGSGNARTTGQVIFRGEDLLQARWDRIRAVRWAGASVVFQGAMSALNPVRTVGEQINEPILLH